MTTATTTKCENMSLNFIHAQGSWPERLRPSAVSMSCSVQPITGRFGFEGVAPDYSMRTAALEVADRHGLTVQQLKGEQRCKPIVLARHEAMWTMHRQGKTLGEIGRFLGGRDHTTVKHGVEKHEERMKRSMEAA